MHDRLKAVREAVALIPRSASVGATSLVGAQVAQREPFTCLKPVEPSQAFDRDEDYLLVSLQAKRCDDSYEAGRNPRLVIGRYR